MGFFSSILNSKKPRGFNYSPRYYDPKQEEREKRRKRILQEVRVARGETIPADEYVSPIKNRLIEQKIYRSRIVKKSRRRTTLILLALIGLLYILFFIL